MHCNLYYDGWREAGLPGRKGPDNDQRSEYIANKWGMP